MMASQNQQFFGKKLRVRVQKAPKFCGGNFGGISTINEGKSNGASIACLPNVCPSGCAILRLVKCRETP
jgi:hypothetical protein